MEGGNDAFDVKWEKRDAGGRPTWVINGTYGPVGDDVEVDLAFAPVRDTHRLRGASLELHRAVGIQTHLEVGVATGAVKDAYRHLDVIAAPQETR